MGEVSSAFLPRVGMAPAQVRIPSLAWLRLQILHVRLDCQLVFACHSAIHTPLSHTFICSTAPHHLLATILYPTAQGNLIFGESLSANMGAHSRVRAAALAVALASTTLVRGQSFFYEEPWESCTADQVFEELGCFQVQANQAPFKHNPSNPVPAGVDASQTYIIYAKDGIVDNTVNRSSCTRTCRAHDFKYASLFANGCQCGMSLSSSLDLTVATHKSGNCGDPCFGDPNEFTWTRRSRRPRLWQRIRGWVITRLWVVSRPRNSRRATTPSRNQHRPTRQRASQTVPPRAGLLPTWRAPAAPHRESRHPSFPGQPTKQNQQREVLLRTRLLRRITAVRRRSRQAVPDPLLGGY